MFYNMFNSQMTNTGNISFIIARLLLNVEMNKEEESTKMKVLHNALSSSVFIYYNIILYNIIFAIIDASLTTNND